MKQPATSSERGSTGKHRVRTPAGGNMKLAAEKRDAEKVSALRSAGRIPAVVYNKELNIPVSVNTREFDRVFREAGSGTLINLDVGSEKHSVLVKAVQMNKRSREPQHVDFYAVTAGQKVQVGVNIILEGTPQGVRDGGNLDVHRREVVISVEPRLIPAQVEVDISGLTIGDSLHIKDIASLLPAEADLVDSEDLTICAVVAPRIAEEPEEETTATEPELVGEDASEADEGEAEEG